MLRYKMGSILLLPSKHIFQGSSEATPWLEAGLGGVGWAWGSPEGGRGDFGVVGMGDLCEECHKSVNFVTKATLSWLAQRHPSSQPRKGPSLLCAILPAPQMPRVALRGDGYWG